MSDNILEPTINGLPPVTDWQKVFLALQQANEAFLRGATLPELGKQIIGDVQIQGSDFVDLPVATSTDPVALPIPSTGNKFGFLANGKFTQPTGETLEYSATQWGLTLFDGDKWVKKFTLEIPSPEMVDNLDSKDSTKALAASQGPILDKRTMIYDSEIAMSKSIANIYLSTGTGETATFNGYSLQVYPVTAGDQIQIESSVTLNLAACIFSFFNSDTIGTGSFVSAGGSPFYGAVTKPWKGIVTVPTGATFLAVSNFTGFVIKIAKAQDVATYSKELGAKVDELEDQGLPNLADSQVVKMVGENLYIGVKYDATNDLLIQFCKSMFNELMTFYRVGLSPNDGLLPAKDVDRSPTTVINLTDSDNIGPINLTTGSWTGGNHSYLNQGEFKTANTVSFEFFADGIKLKDGDLVRCKRVEVRVKNKIKDTGKPTKDGGGNVTGLDVDFCDEDVVYTVEKGCISVVLSHKYLEGTATGISTYYGMQSVFIGETQVLTANGAYKNFTAKASVVNFNKVDFPNFNRFVEKNTANNTYQTAYLINGYGIGNHSKILPSDFIFVYASDKCYHRLLANQTVQSPQINSWSGMYSWNKPLQDDANLLVTTGTINGKDYIFIDAKTAFNGYVSLPSQYTLKDFEILENFTDAAIGSFIEVYGISVSFLTAGTIVISIK